MSALLTVLRLLLGTVFVAHGGQKLLGWFGGDGIEGAKGEMRELGLKPEGANAVAVGAAQLGGGVMLGAGLLTPVAATITCSSMLTAIWAKCLKKGFFSRQGGYEYPLLLGVATLVVAADPGRLSADRALGIERTGGGVALAALAAASAGSLGVHLLAERSSEQAL